MNISVTPSTIRPPRLCWHRKRRRGTCFRTLTRGWRTSLSLVASTPRTQRWTSPSPTLSRSSWQVTPPRRRVMYWGWPRLERRSWLGQRARGRTCSLLRWHWRRSAAGTSRLSTLSRGFPQHWPATRVWTREWSPTSSSIGCRCS